MSQTTGSIALLPVMPSEVPLERVHEALLSRLLNVLWAWPLRTEDSDALSPRKGQFQRYFQFYKAAVLIYVENSSQRTRVLKTHDDLFNAISGLKNNPSMTRIGLNNLICSGNTTPARDVESAVTLTVKIFTTIDCSALHQSSDRLEMGFPKIQWKDEVAFSKYIEDLFPSQKHPIFSSTENDIFFEAKSQLRATKLKKHLGITIQATHDVRNHLRFDRRHNILEIFHHTAFLKEQLRATKGAGDYSNPSNSLKV